MSEKPAILQETQFTVEEGVTYRVMRTGAIWLNKLFFSCLVLLAIWLAIAAVTDDVACVPSVDVGSSNGTVTDGPGRECTVWLTPTAKYLGAMAVLSFLGSLAFGALGLMAGKKILEVTPAAAEVGARREGFGDDAVEKTQAPPKGP